MENRNGLIVSAMATQAYGYKEREGAKSMVADVRQLNPAGEITLKRPGYRGGQLV